MEIESLLEKSEILNVDINLNYIHMKYDLIKANIFKYPSNFPMVLKLGLVYQIWWTDSVVIKSHYKKK